MKKFYEGFKDFLYDSIDYIIIIGIIGIVIFVISWRLDLLFAKDVTGINNKYEVVIDNNDRNDDNNKEKLDDNESVEDNNHDIVDEEPEEDDDKIEEPSDKIVKVIIPAGSLPSKIGTILEGYGLISSKADFVLKSQELKLDTKLKSGTYEINTNSSLEEIIKQISK